MILIVDCGSSKTPFIEDLVEEFDDHKTVPVLAFETKDLEGINGVIISGAPILITEQNIDAYLENLSWIKDTKIPVLGICFGHQIIGLTFGAYASRMREDRDWLLIGKLEDSEILDKLPEEFEMMEDHCEAISIPVGFRLIATSDNCVNEAMRHNSLPLFGVQFHPEVSGNYGRTIFENFIRITNNVQS